MNLFSLPETEKPRDHSGKFAPVKKDPMKSVKLHLESGLSISVLDCLRLYHSTELRVFIAKLRKRGMPVTDWWYEENGVKRYKLYRLKK